MRKRQKKLWVSYLIVTTVCVALGTGLAACTSPEDTVWKRVQETGVLRVGMDASYPPFEAVAGDGTLVGFDVDLAREVGRRLDVEVQFVANLPYDGLYDALTVGRVDVIMSALVVDPAHMADFAYSIPYFDAGQVLVLPRGENEISKLADLKGHSLAVALGTQGDLEARRWARRMEDLTIVTRETAAKALNAVEAEEANAALVDHVSALTLIEAESGLTIVGDPVVEAPYAIATRKESRRLLRAIDEALTAMKEDGTLEALRIKWLKSNNP